LITAAVVLRLPSLLAKRWYNPDEAAIAMLGQALRRGQTLYVDMADRKPPLAAFVYQFSSWLTGTDDARLPRLIAALALGLAAWVVGNDLAARFGRRAGWWGAVLLVGSVMAAVPADAAAANFSNLAVPIAAIAIVLLRRPSTLAAAGGGLALATAVLCRQSWMFAGPAALCSLILASSTIPQRLRRIGAAAAGGLVALGLVALTVPFADFWRWTFTSNGGFLFSSVDVATVAQRGAASIGLFVAWHLALLGGAAVALSAVTQRRSRAELDLWLWVVTGLVAVIAGFRFFGHYWMQVIPPLVLLGAAHLANWQPRWRQITAGVVAVTALAALAAQATPGSFRKRTDPAPISAAVQQLTAATDPVFIWGSFPEFGVAVQRPVAGGMVHSDFVTGRSGGHSAGADTLRLAMDGAIETMLDNLRASPPAIIVDTSTSSSLGYENYPMSIIPALGDFVEQGYERAQTVAGVTLWVRTSKATTERHS